MGRGAASPPPEPMNRVLHGLLDRYSATVDDPVNSDSLAVSARGYFLARVAERRCAEGPSFNNVLKMGRIDENGVEEAKEPGLPPRYVRAIHRKMGTHREKIEQAAIDGEGGEPKAASITTFSPAPTDKVNERLGASARNVQERQSLGRIENHGRSESSSINSVISMNMRRSQRLLRGYKKYGRSMSSTKNTVHTPSNRTTPTKELHVPSRVRSNSPSLVNMKSVSDHGEVERSRTKSAISQPLSTASEYKPAVPKTLTRTNSSTMLQRSAEVYRRHKNVPSNHTSATEASPGSSRARHFNAPLVNMKPVSDHGKVQSLPSKSVISQPISIASKAKPAVPKVPTRTIPSTLLQRSAGEYRHHKMMATPQSLIELKLTPTFEASDSFDLKHSTSSEGASFEDDISFAASLFSVASINNALLMADMGTTKSPPRQGKAVPYLNDVCSGSIKSNVPQKKKLFDD
jgi:hypothetical protein